MAGTPGQSPWRALRGLPLEAGVDLFFVISGFVMVYSSRNRFGAPGASRDFLGRRIARIVPLYWAATTMFIAVALATPIRLDAPIPSWAAVLASYLFLPFPQADGTLLPVLRVGWTLNYEMFFYVLFACTIALPIRPALLALAGILTALTLLHASGAFSNPQVLFWSDPIVLEFVMGMSLGWLAVRGVRFPRALRWVGALALVVLAVNPALHGFPRTVAFGLPAVGLVAAALAPVRRTPALMVLSRLGAASYAIYVLHLFVARSVREIWHAVFGSTGLGVFVVLTIAGTVLAATLTHTRFEVPATRFCRRLLCIGKDRRNASNTSIDGRANARP